MKSDYSKIGGLFGYTVSNTVSILGRVFVKPKNLLERSCLSSHS